MRKYFYYIDIHGRLFHDNTELIDKKFLNFFFKRVTKNDTGSHTDYPFISPCGKEMNYIKVADTPFVLKNMIENKLYYAPDLFVEFQPQELMYSQSGSVYHPVNSASMGRFHTNLLLKISENIETFEDGYILHWENKKYILKKNILK